MKTFKILFALIATVAIFSSCKTEEQDAPKISFGETTNPMVAPTYENGIYKLNLPVTVTADGKIGNTVIKKYNDESVDEVASAKLTKDVSGDNGQTTFAWSLKDDVSEQYNKVVYEIIITDKQSPAKTTSAKFTVLKTAEIYLVTFTCNVNGAEIAINSQTLAVTNGVAQINLPNGTYTYTATATGYNEATGNIIVDGAVVTEAITMTAATTNLTDWSAEKTLSGTVSGSTIVDNGVGEAYGFKYTTQTASEIKLTPHNGAEFYTVSNATIFTTKEDLATAINGQAAETQILCPFDYTAKAYSEKQFISKVGSELYLIKVTESKVNVSANDRHIKFQEKH